MTNSHAPRQGEIWHARFGYDDGRGYKYRPVIVVGTSEGGSIVMMVTSAANKLSLEHDYLLKDWEREGLDKPSIARVDRIAEIPAGYLGTAGRIGRLSERDEAEINALLASITSEEEGESEAERVR